MKNIIFIILSIPLLVFTSCHKEEDYKAKRRIINETNHSVNLEVFGDDERFEYELEASETVEIEGSCTCCVSRICNIGWRRLPYANIIFDDSLQLSYVGQPDDCNQKAINTDPYVECFGYLKTREDGWVVYTYRITQEDYESAEPISGN